MQKKIAINQLLPGMKVIDTDIGWQKLPYWQAPFVIRSGEDIVRLNQHCKTVIIEVADKISEPQITPSNSVDSTVEQKKSALKPVVKNANQALRDKISASFAVESYQHTLKVLSAAFNQIRSQQSFRGEGLYESMNNLLLSSLALPETLALICNLKEKDASLERKSLDVAVLSLMFGKALGLKKQQLHQLGLAALLHDIGMLKIPEALLTYKGSLSVGQRQQIQRHVEAGCYMLSANKQFKPLVGIIAYHHERFDGLGYPAGLKGRKIPLQARILQITTVFEALTRNRNYSTQHSTTNALSKLYSWRNKDLDGKLVESFIKTVGVYPAGTLVRLNNGFTGIVTDVHPSHRSRPSMQLLYNGDGKEINQTTDLDLTQEKYKKLQITKSLDPDEVPKKILSRVLGRMGLQGTDAA
jgi:HD-GYP domain-containing protein (c-di-GMP phosphodiesterase class II)